VITVKGGIIQDMRIPKKISPSPIVEAVAEIRFENELPSEVIFGKLYGELSDQYGKTEQLPILQLPAQLRDTQPELKYAPHYRLRSDNFLVTIGQRVISINRISQKEKYNGWDEFFVAIQVVLEKVKKLGFASEIERVSVRYINFFDEKVPTVLNLEVGLFAQKVDQYNDLTLAINRDVDTETNVHILMSSNAKIESEGEAREGLVFNVEAIKHTQTTIDQAASVVDGLHKHVEETFFTALQEQYLTTLSPEYDD
jgi:uncharacterized protein (TIGR04255 family)